MQSGTEEQLLQLSLTGRLPPSMQKSFDDEKQKGNAAYLKTRYHEAIHHYTAAESINPISPIPPANRAMVYLKLKQYERAAAEAAIAFELHQSLPKEDRSNRLCAKILLRRATANKELMLFALAAEDYHSVLELEHNAAAQAELKLLKEQYGIIPSVSTLRSRSNEPPQPKISVLSEHVEKAKDSLPIASRRPRLPSPPVPQDDTEILRLSTTTMQQLVLNWSTTEPRNATEFERALSSLEGDSMAQAKYLLDVVGAQSIENGLLGEILTPQMMQCVIEALSVAVSQHPQYSRKAADSLLAFSKVSRFQMILMFLSSAEKRAVTSLIQELQNSDVPSLVISNIRMSYV